MLISEPAATLIALGAEEEANVKVPSLLKRSFRDGKVEEEICPMVNALSFACVAVARTAATAGKPIAKS